MADVASRAADEAGDWLEPAARVGYAARGFVYIVVGYLALLAAWGGGGQTTDTKGALQKMLEAPFGQVLLGLVALGLVCYAVWRFIQGFQDADGHGNDAKGIATRIGLVISGITNVLLAYFALSLIFPALVGGGGSSGGGGNSDITAKLLSQPYGQWLVGILGLIVIGVGITHFVKAAKAKFEKYLDMRGRENWMRRTAQFGLSARGVTFLIIGGFFLVAAYQADPSEARGLGGALSALQQQPFGWILLGIVALGLLAFAVYSFILARYRRINA